jgi:hypothetical protein
MKARTVKLVLIAITLCMPVYSAYAIDSTAARAFVGRDVHISGEKLVSFHGSSGEEVLVIEGKFLMSAGADTFGGNKVVVWIKRGEGKSVSVWAYVSGRVSASKGKGTRLPGLKWEMVEQGRAIVIRFEATGEVFVTTKSRESGDLRSGEFYRSAFSAVTAVDKGFADKFGSVSPARIEPTAEPNLPKPVEPKREPIEPRRESAEPKEEPAAVRQGLRPSSAERPLRPEQSREAEVIPRQVEGAFGFIERILGPLRKPQAKVPESRPQAKIRYPVNLAPAGDIEPNVEWGPAANRAEVATIIGRFYLWQRQDEQGRLLEMQADAAVVFYSGGKTSSGEKPGGIQDLGAAGAIEAVYVYGDVVMTEGLRTIRADEMYYEFEEKRGLAVNATVRSFDVSRGIPIYVRAARVRQLAEGTFAAEDVVLTSSEFYVPQISARASRVLVTDTTTIDQIKDSSYDVQMRDVRLKSEETTIFYWPFVRSNLERPDIPFKSIRVGRDGIWGTSVESRWYLSRLLGLREPEGTDGTLELDYHSKRGVGIGTDVDYAQENRLGRMTGYIIEDRGEDRLGRDASRRDLEPPRELRGRFGWVHREFMPYNWQVTTGINYESDEHFVESFYRKEFNTGEGRETYLHLKRIEDNWGLSFLGKGRLNSFADELEESPTAEYHLTGQSIFNDKLTLYSDTQGGRYRQRIGKHHETVMSDEYFTFGSHRSELDAPVWMSGVKAVPYIAGTVGYDDRSGFNRSLVDGTNAGSFNERVVGIGEGGLRVSSQYWKVYPGARSRLWDLDGLRHIVRPELVTAVYEESDPAVKQHDVVHIELSQRLQTKRGTGDNERTSDWMRLDLGGTWFTDNEERTEDSGPYRFIWNRPMTPLRMFTMPGILNGDLRDGLKKFETYGPARDYFSADYVWQISDTTALLSDAYYDIHRGTFEQVDVGFSRTRWPDLSYYIGSRYLRNVKVLDEHGSNAFVFAASYVLDPRYTIVFSQQFDFDYGANVESNITLIRRYHRVFWSLTFSADASLDRQAIMFSIWPEGVPELALGSRRYTGLSAPGGY